MKLGLVCGGGILPELVIEALQRDGVPFCVAVLAGEADQNLDIPTSISSRVFGWGQIGAFFEYLEKENVDRILAIGSVVQRPDFSALKIDTGAIKLLPKIFSILKGGDDSVLRGVATIFEDRGFKVVGIRDVAPSLLVDEGKLVGRIAAAGEADIAIASNAIRMIGSLDFGQAAVAASGRLISLEGPEGTERMLRRIGEIKAEKRARWKSGEGVLVKLCKPGQDERFDLPAIGPDTIDQVAKAGLSGIAVEAGRVIVLRKEEVVERSRKAGLFFVGISARREAS